MRQIYNKYSSAKYLGKILGAIQLNCHFDELNEGAEVG